MMTILITVWKLLLNELNVRHYSTKMYCSVYYLYYFRPILFNWRAWTLFILSNLKKDLSIKKLAILFSILVVGCASKQQPVQNDEPEIIQPIQVTEDAGYLCKDSHTASCNLLRNYCVNNNTDEDCSVFNKAVESKKWMI